MIGLGLGLGIGSDSGRKRRARVRRKLDNFSHSLIIPVQILEAKANVEAGQIISTLTPPWIAIYDQITQNPDLLFEFSKHPRAFEEFVASSYDKQGYRVTLTPSSGDGGRDVIAEKSGFASIRILDQCKAFGKGRTVSPNDVRAMMGTLYHDRNASKAVITTTSRFAPSVKKEWAEAIPYRLELREGKDLVDWINSAKGKDA